jgi:beta-N-acetylhexosaminidase
VVPTAKHFPGFGAAQVNTDLETAEIDLSKRKLRRIDEAPYERTIPATDRMVMLSVAAYPSFSKKPAALSHALATKELRGRVGFRGASVSDSLDSAAAQAVGSPRRLAILGAKAGTDLLLFTSYHHALAAGAALRQALRHHHLPRRPFIASAQRVAELRTSLPGP